MKKTLSLLVIAALAFFACSNDSDPKNEPETLIPNGTADISSQVYLLQKEQQKQAEQCTSNKDKTCFLNAINIPYTSNGIIKNIVEDTEGTPLDTVEVGTIINGKIDLKFYTPKEEHLSKNGIQAYWVLKLYDNANKPIGRLFLENLEDIDDSFAGYWAYYSNDYKYEETWDLFQEYDHKFVTYIDVEKGWNLIYENDKDDYENGTKILSTLTKTNNPDILKGKKLKWYLLDPDAH